MDYNGQREVTSQINKPPCCWSKPNGQKADTSAMQCLQESASMIIIQRCSTDCRSQARPCNHPADLIYFYVDKGRAEMSQHGCKTMFVCMILFNTQKSMKEKIFHDGETIQLMEKNEDIQYIQNHCLVIACLQCLPRCSFQYGCSSPFFQSSGILLIIMTINRVIE